MNFIVTDLFNKIEEQTIGPEKNSIQSLISFSPSKLKSVEKTQSQALDPKSVVWKAADRDAFLSLLETITVAKNRKDDLLAALEVINVLLQKSLPSSKEVLGHLQWVHGSLEKTNELLATSVKYLEILYPGAHSSGKIKYVHFL